MSVVPSDTCWYLADIVLECIVEGDTRNVVQVNTHLIEAGSPDQAYQKALALGTGAQCEYLNTAGKQVRFVFRGLRELNVVHEALEDGAELAYSETMDVPEHELRQWTTPKEQLGVFARTEPKTDGPDYTPESVMIRLEAHGFSREDMLNGTEIETDLDSTATDAH